MLLIHILTYKNMCTDMYMNIYEPYTMGINGLDDDFKTFQTIVEETS